MGRIIVFVEDNCEDSEAVRITFEKYEIGHLTQEICLTLYPKRRADMISLTGSLRTPQVFFNEKHIGSKNELITLLKQYNEAATNSSFSIKELIQNELNRKNLAEDMVKLSIPDKATASTTSQKDRQDRLDLLEKYDLVELPDQTSRSIYEVIDVLKQNVCQKCKYGFSGKTAIKMLMKEYNIRNQAKAVTLGQKLTDIGVLHPSDDVSYQVFDSDGFYQLQPLKNPTILNSYRTYTDQSGFQELYPDPRPFATLSELFKTMTDIISSETDDNGLVDYHAIRCSDKFRQFERNVCQFQLIDVQSMSEQSRKAFFINIYHLLMMHGIVRTKSNKARTFFIDVKYKIGDFVLSLDQIFHGILRCNTFHPGTRAGMFPRHTDPKRSLCLHELDDRIHFAINEVGGSCALMYEFHEDAIEEELRIISELFCATEEMVSIDVQTNALTIPDFMAIYLFDFRCRNLDDIPKVIIQYLKGNKRRELHSLIVKSDRDEMKINLHFHFGDTIQNYKFLMTPSKFKKLRGRMVGEKTKYSKGTSWNNHEGGDKHTLHTERSMFWNLIRQYEREAPKKSRRTRISFFICTRKRKGKKSSIEDQEPPIAPRATEYSMTPRTYSLGYLPANYVTIKGGHPPESQLSRLDSYALYKQPASDLSEDVPYDELPVTKIRPQAPRLVSEFALLQKNSTLKSELNSVDEHSMEVSTFQPEMSYREKNGIVNDGFDYLIYDQT